MSPTFEQVLQERALKCAQSIDTEFGKHIRKAMAAAHTMKASPVSVQRRFVDMIVGTCVLLYANVVGADEGCEGAFANLVGIKFKELRRILAEKKAN